MAFDTKNIRNIALFGHGNSGKTTLNEAALYTANMITDMGRVDDGKTVSDWTEQEIAKKISINSSISYLEWNKTLINIIDNPGSPDFVGEVSASMRITDSAIFVVNAEAGVEIETLKIWRKCDLPKLVFINKMDKENADYEKCLANLKENFKDVTFVPLSIPIGRGKDFKGIVDLVEKEARYPENNGKTVRKEKVPDSVVGLEDYFKEMVEVAVETDDALMHKYFEGEELTNEEIITGLKKAIVTGKIVPVLVGNSIINSGTVALLDCVVNYMPSPEDSDSLVGINDKDEEVVVENKSDQPIALFVFKTTIDQFSGKISYFRVKRGKVTRDIELLNSNYNIKEKCGKLYKVVGKALKEVEFLNSGDIGAFTKLASVNTNDTLCDPKSIVKLPKIEFPQPIYSQAITAPNKNDEEKMINLLQKASEEDPTFKIAYNAETKQNVISGMGEMQIKLILKKIKDKNKIEAILSDPLIPYRETIKKRATAEYTHKKQSGGHGQYGKVVIDIWPLETGKYYQFENGIVGGVISKGYFPGCEKGFHEAMEDGVLAGFHVVDIGVKLIDGKEHPVDSSEMSFKIASREAFKEAMRQASPVLLEPIMELSVYVEQKYVGDVLSDLSSKRGKVLGQESLGNIELIKALVPQKELLKYSIDLKSITSGTGSFEVKFDSYQSITGKLADDIIAETKKNRAEGE